MAANQLIKLCFESKKNEKIHCKDKKYFLYIFDVLKNS